MCGWDGTLQLMNGPVVFHHCYCGHNEAPAKGNQISQHLLLRCHELRLSWDDHTGRMVMQLAKLRDKICKIHTISRLSMQESSEWSLFLYLWVLLLHFTTAHSMVSAARGQGHSNMFWCIQIWQLSELILLIKGLRHPTRNEEKIEMRTQNVDFKQIILLWSLNFLNVISQTDNMDFEPPWLLVMWLNRVGGYWTWCRY